MHVERADPPERLADAVRQAIEDLKRDIAPDPVKTAVVSLQGPVSDDAFAKIRSACQPYRFPIAFVVFGSGAGAAQGADALIVTVYDGSNAEPQLIQHRCDAYATLRQRKRWKAIACCEDNDLQQREEPRP